jgi:hypothetical protein
VTTSESFLDVWCGRRLGRTPGTSIECRVADTARARLPSPVGWRSTVLNPAPRQRSQPGTPAIRTRSHPTCDLPVPDRVQMHDRRPLSARRSRRITPSSQVLRLIRTESRRNWTPDWTPCPAAIRRQNTAFSRAFLRSGRQELNLRPPGPQPERSRRIGCDSVLWGGLSCSELRSVAPNLHPRLHPRGRERSSSRAPATHSRGARTDHPRYRVPR